jgi:hypothetical protein
MRTCSTYFLQEADRSPKVLMEVTKRIKELGRAGRPRDAVMELAQMAKMGVQPDKLAATALLDACMRNNKVDMAESVSYCFLGEWFGSVCACDPDRRYTFWQL